MIASQLSALILAHSWYPQSCCGGKDCRPVPCEQIHQGERDNDHGYFWQVGPNYEIYFSAERVHPSLDEGCHACVSDGYLGVCLFLAARI